MSVGWTCQYRKPSAHHIQQLSAVVALVCGLLPSVATSAEPTLPPDLQVKVDAALSRAVLWLRKENMGAGSAEGSLVAYSLLKGKVSPDDPAIVRQRDAVLRKIDGGCYRDDANPQHHIYEAGCDAMLLEALDPAEYRDQLTEIRDYLIRRQLSSGGWHYPNPPPPSPSGDTSITQYGVLGLWAIQRARIDVPRNVWSNATKYHSATQRTDGGFLYHPYEGGGGLGRFSTGSMSVAGLGSTLVAQLMLYATPVETPASGSAKRRFGVLEQLQDREAAATKTATPRPSSETLVSRETFKKIIPSAEQAVGRLFEDALKGPHPVYFLYGCERAGALLGSDKLGDVVWYERGSDYLVLNQQSDGSWRGGGGYDPRIHTALAILFLSRATKTLVAPRRPPRPVGAGLLVGARGLPKDLSSVTIQGGTVEQRVPKGDVDILLSELEQPSNVSLPDAPRNLIEQIDLQNPEQLVGQIDRLRRLVDHRDSEVRQVVAWALGRSGDLREAPRLIQMLNDADPVVAWEASLGLCVLSRFPFGITPEGAKQPLSIAPPGVNSEESDPAQNEWRKKSIAAWDGWYQKVRPYDERDDRRQIRNR